MDIPRDKDYPLGAVQCKLCAGHGCDSCHWRGWYAHHNHPDGRRCARDACDVPIPPAQVAVYCTTHCAILDHRPT